MLEKIHEQITVLTSFNKKENIFIHKLRWNGRLYPISKMSYQHKVREGRNIHHYFNVSNDSLAFKLQFDTEHLTWWLLEVADGEPD